MKHIQVHYPHLAEVSVVIVALILFCNFPAQDNAIFPTLQANKRCSVIQSNCLTIDNL